MKKLSAKIANTSNCALLKPMPGRIAYDVWSGAADAEWDEGKHKRADNGQFGAGASRAAATKHPVGSEAHGHHIAAAEHHEAAEKATDPTAKAEHLEMAKKRTSQAEAAGSPKSPHKTPQEAMEAHGKAAKHHDEQSKNTSLSEEAKKAHYEAHQTHYAAGGNVNLNREMHEQKPEWHEQSVRAYTNSEKAKALSEGGMKPMPSKVGGLQGNAEFRAAAARGRANPRPDTPETRAVFNKPITPMPSKAAYNATAVNKAIGSSKQEIGGKEAKAIHRLMKGRHE